MGRRLQRRTGTGDQMARRSLTAREADQRAADAFAFGAGRCWLREGDAVIHLGRRFALGDLMLRFARTVGRTLRLSVANPALVQRDVAAGAGSRMNRLLDIVRELGPYTALALVLPGGSLIAIAAWAFRRRTPFIASVGRLLIIATAFAGALILPVSA